jgi:hypothetical protein
MMTTILERIEQLGADASVFVTDERVYVTLEDFDGFDENWCEIDRPFDNPELVEALLEWLRAECDCADEEFSMHYYFGGLEIIVQYSSMDI